MNIIASTGREKNPSRIFIYSDPKELNQVQELQTIIKVAQEQIVGEVSVLSFFEDKKTYILSKYQKDKESYITDENIRMAGYQAGREANRLKLSKAVLHFLGGEAQGLYHSAEAIALGNYQFFPYRTMNPAKSIHSLTDLIIDGGATNRDVINELNAIKDALYLSRDLINKPLNYLTATMLADACKEVGKKEGIKVTVYDKKKIQSLKMGGILSVNLGSQDPPTFTIMEYKPAKPLNKQPIILVGKGVVYDTGGLSLKPTTDSMDHMKCDMAGAAAVIGTLSAAARTKLPLHIIGLIPATDNRPGENAYTPGDVITMYSGKTVEVLNTDAEGRMLLADALYFAQQYNPELCIDLATLTGAAARAIGSPGMAMMSIASRPITDQLIASGYNTYERMVEFPLWREYGEQIKSDIADIKNTGGPAAGAMTAGKFLEHFVNYPWIHLDIAPNAWLFEEKGYRTKGASGVGIRLLYNFLKNRANAKS